MNTNFKGFLLLSFLLISFNPLFAASGFFGGPNATFIVYNLNGGGNTFTDSDNTPSGMPIDLGTVTSLILNGGEAKTFKNGTDDITEVRILYRIYPTGSPSGAFIPITLFFLEDCNTGTNSFPSGGPCNNTGDQKWQTTAHNVDVLAGLLDGTGYTLQFYFEADFVNDGGGGIHNYNNGGFNYALTFTTPPTPPTVPTLSQWGLILLALLMLIVGIVAATAPSLVATNGQMSRSFRINNFPYSKGLYLKIIPFVALGFLAAFLIASLGFGYEMTKADPLGSLLAIPLVSYVVMLLAGQKN